LARRLCRPTIWASLAARFSVSPTRGPRNGSPRLSRHFGLVTVILAGLRFERRAVPWLVGLYITAAYWFTVSTSFANPAVAAARSLTDTFSGIRPADLPGFIVAELLGALIALALMGWLLRPETIEQSPALKAQPFKGKP